MRKLFAVLIILVSASFAQVINGGWSVTGGFQMSNGSNTITPGPLTFYVDNGGSDSNDGSMNTPFATVAHATQACHASAPFSCTVILRGRTGSNEYFFPPASCGAVLCFGSADSGTPSAPVTYTSLPGENPVISGGKVIPASSWTATGNNGTNWKEYTATLDANPADPGFFTNFESLFYNNERRFRPRTSGDSYLYTLGSCFATQPTGDSFAQQLTSSIVGCGSGSWTSFDRFQYSGNDVPSSGHGFKLGDIEMLNFARDTTDRLRLKSAGGGVAITTGPTFTGDIIFSGFLCASGGAHCAQGHKFLIENVFENLNQDKQFYLDRCPLNSAQCTSTTPTPENSWRLHYLAYNSPTSSLLTSLTTNNTASCSGNGVPDAGCNAAFVGFVTKNTHTGAQTTTYNPVPSNVSTISVHNLMYKGWSGKAIAEYQPWFCNSSNPCNSHTNIGMNENNSAAVHQQVGDMIQRGFDIVLIDWYGQTPAQSFNLTTSNLVQADVDSRQIHGGPFKFAILEDGGSFKVTCPTNGGGTDQTNCIMTALESDMDYINTKYCSDQNYWNDGGKCVVGFFVNEGDWTNPSPNWTGIWTNVKAHTNAYAKQFKFLFQFGSFTHTATDGEFGWPQPPAWSSTQQFWFGSSTGLSPTYLDSLYDGGKANPTLLTVGIAYKGFDESVSTFATQDRVIAQQCGQVVAKTIAEVQHNSDFGTSNQLPYMQFATWNDYEEGTEEETGIDNCYTISATIDSNHFLNWTLTPSDSTYASRTTIDHFTIYYGDSNGNLFVAKDNIPANTSRADLSRIIPHGTWNIYVQMVGVPLIRNQMSSAVAFTGSATLNNEDPTNPNNEIIVPQQTTLLSMNGTHDVTISGWTFADDNYTVPSVGLGDQQGSPMVPGALRLIDTQNITLTSVTIRNIQGAGIEIFGDGSGTSTGNQVLNSSVYDIGSIGLRIGRWPCGSIKGPPSYPINCTAVDTAANVSNHNTVTNTQFVGLQRLIPSGIGGVWIGNSGFNTFTNNEIGDTYSGGIGIGFTFGRQNPNGSLTCPTVNAPPLCLASTNAIDENFFHDIGQGTTYDMGAIYFATSNTSGNEAHGNYVRDITHDTITPDGYGGNCYYADQGASAVSWLNNFCLRPTHSGYFNNLSDHNNDTFAQNNTFQNGIIAYPGDDAFRRGGNNPSAFTAVNNITYNAKGRIQACPGQWACNPGGSQCQGGWQFNHNDYALTNGLTLDLVIGNASGGTCDSRYTHYTSLSAWSAGTNQDNSSPISISADPKFTDPTYPNDIYTFQGGSPYTSINFTPLDSTAYIAGRTSTTLSAPTVPQGIPRQLVDVNSFFGEPLSVSTPCGPPGYNCSNSNKTSVVQYPGSIPTMGPAGSIVTPTDFNDPIVRITDPALISGNCGANSSSEVTYSGGNDDLDVNSNTTLIAVTCENQGVMTVVGFNPTTMQVTGNVPNFIVPGLEFSRVNPNIAYGANGLNLLKYTFNGVGNTPTTSTIFNMQNCPGLPTNFMVTNTVGVSVNANDEFLVTGLSNQGTQDTAQYVIAYQQATGLCQVYNTLTAQITGNFGSTGTASDTATYKMHSANITNGEWIQVSVAGEAGSCVSGDCTETGTIYFWQPGTTTVNVCRATSDLCGGHNTSGYTHYFNFVAFPQADLRLTATPGTIPATPWTGLTPATGIDNAHASWNYGAPNDSTAIITTSSASTYVAPNTISFAFWEEIDGYMNDGTGSIRRFAHCYKGTSPYFRTQECIGATDPTGRYEFFSSNWVGTLGTDSLGNPTSSVFAVQLR